MSPRSEATALLNLGQSYFQIDINTPKCFQDSLAILLSSGRIDQRMLLPLQLVLLDQLKPVGLGFQELEERVLQEYINLRLELSPL
jgi:hypothetical protein